MNDGNDEINSLILAESFNKFGHFGGVVAPEGAGLVGSGGGGHDIFLGASGRNEGDFVVA